MKLLKILAAGLIVFCMCGIPVVAMDFVSAASKKYLPWWVVIGFLLMLPLWYYVMVKELKQLLLILPLLLCLSASAATLPPFPTVTRKAPLQSPKAASVPKSTPMVRFTPASELPPVPMQIAEPIPTSDGRVTLIIDAFKPANTSMEFFYGPTVLGPWSLLATWGPYPEAQWVGLAWTRDPEQVFVSAKHGVPSTMSPASAVALPSGVIKLPPSKTKPKRLQ